MSASSLSIDRKVKAALYAAAGFAESWVVGLKSPALFVYREPTEGEWGREQAFGEDGVAPLFAPARAVSLRSAFVAA